MSSFSGNLIFKGADVFRIAKIVFGKKFYSEITRSSIVSDVVTLQYLYNERGFAVRKM
jgi:hypothetical protein